MTRSSWFGRAVSVLWFLLVTQLAYAGQTCVSPMDRDAADPQGIMKGGCESPSTAPVCVATPQRLDVTASAAASLSPDSPPGADVPRDVQATLVAAAEPRLSAGLAPGSPAPFYILFHRYLS